MFAAHSKLVQSLTITSESQLLALLNVKYGLHLLRQFQRESTVSQVAARLGETPSRVAYHVGKLEQFGFLRLVRVRGRQRFLMLAVARVEVPAPLMAGVARDHLQRFLTELMASYLASTGLETPKSINFDLLSDQPLESPGGSRVQFRSVALSRRTFEQAMAAAWRVIQEAPVESQGELFTLVLLGFQGSPLPMSGKDASDV